MRRVLLVTVLVVGGCSLGGKKDDDTPTDVWTRFNSPDDVLEIEVTAADPDAEPAPPLTAELHSSTGEVVIGTVTITPGSGPVGTIHTVQVTIDQGETDDPWYDQVGRVEFEADAGDRGTWTIALDQDSALPGVWVREITSYGDEGEVRTDTFSFDLYELTPVEGEDAPIEE